MENYEMKLANFKTGFCEMFSPEKAYTEDFERDLGRVFDILNSDQYKYEVKAQDDYVYFGNFNPDSVCDFLSLKWKKEIDEIHLIAEVEGEEDPDICLWTDADGKLLCTNQKNILNLMDENFQENIFTTLFEPYLLDHPEEQYYLDSPNHTWRLHWMLLNIWSSYNIEARYDTLLNETWNGTFRTNFCQVLKKCAEVRIAYEDLSYLYF